MSDLTNQARNIAHNEMDRGQNIIVYRVAFGEDVQVNLHIRLCRDGTWLWCDKYGNPA